MPSFRSHKARQNGGLAPISQSRGAMQLPMLNLADTSRNNAVAALGEFVGTFLFLFWSFAGTQISNTPMPPAGSNPNPSALLYASLAFGFSLTVNVWAFYRITGGLFNPSVTMALFLVGGLPAIRSVILVVAQILGGICAAAVVSALFPGALNVETTLGGGANVAQGLFIEMFLTSQLIFVIIMLAVVKHKSTFLAPVGIGLTFFLTELCGIYYTGGSLNFARSLGPAIVNHHFPHYFWIYFLGPLLGSGLASGFYALLNMMRYQTVNPGQDCDSSETATLMTTQSLSNHSAATGGAGYPSTATPKHQRNESEATAASPTYNYTNAQHGQSDSVYEKQGENAV
ncbi:aquaporin-like protein [Talaromyces proteolyticus]|uniref:Aquaporin-like protein n=1 Tax=Talaromyces proteolyticus TaxID=1131652 RepID=A0AAD4KEU6_9EURO|nr:aquaporin-like protein [Talaromyces proteolyticus]KAH8689984.1 aquaporin-like protein [Talaromyces proteolyticus]